MKRTEVKNHTRISIAVSAVVLCAVGQLSAQERQLHIRNTEVRVLLEDSSTSAARGTGDWLLSLNPGGTEQFRLRFCDPAGPASLDCAGLDVLALDSTGAMGLGTSLPGADLEIYRLGEVGLQLTNASVLGGEVRWTFGNDVSGNVVLVSADQGQLVPAPDPGPGEDDGRRPVGICDPSYCSVAILCSSGQGDCDSDAECLPGLACVSGQGSTHCPPSVDVCSP